MLAAQSLGNEAVHWLLGGIQEERQGRHLVSGVAAVHWREQEGLRQQQGALVLGVEPGQEVEQEARRQQ